MKRVSFSPPDISDDEINEVISVLKSGWITTGPKTKEFEHRIASYCGTPRAACLNSATASMELALRILGVGRGDEVITSAYTYTASASVICHVGATPILVDTDEGSFEMDYDKLASAVTTRTKAIIPVDIGGMMCDYDQIMDIVRAKNDQFSPATPLQNSLGRICILADAAHSFGAEYGNQKSGSMADFTAFSFHAVKSPTTAEGGSVTWTDCWDKVGIESEWIYQQFMLMSLHGQSKDALSKSKVGQWEYDIVEPWYKCNMTDIMAGFGLAQLRRHDDIMARRREIIDIYDKGLADLPVWIMAHEDEKRRSSGHLYLIRLMDKDSEKRNKVITKMGEIGVACNVHFKPLPMFTAYKKLGFDINDFKNAYNMYHNQVSLPLHTLMSDEDALYVVQSLKEVIACV